MSINALIVDDEPHAREGISIRLKQYPDINIVGECSSGLEAVHAIQELQPDLLFLDIQMPEMNGIEVVQHIMGTSSPIIVFVTAYDKYAIKAFEYHALDYLLKPISDERFHDMIKTVLAEFHNRNLAKYAARLQSVVNEPGSNPPVSGRSGGIAGCGKKSFGNGRLCPFVRARSPADIRMTAAPALLSASASNGSLPRSGTADRPGEAERWRWMDFWHSWFAGGRGFGHRRDPAGARSERRSVARCRLRQRRLHRADHGEDRALRKSRASIRRMDSSLMRQSAARPSWPDSTRATRWRCRSLPAVSMPRSWRW